METYAIEITRITGVPCFYYLCDWEPNAGRWAYILGWVKDESDDGEIDFPGICREKATLLVKKCREICQSLEAIKLDDDSFRTHLQECAERSKEDSSAVSGDEDSTFCPYKMRCRFGLDCRNKHTQEEMDSFVKATDRKGARGYKT